MPYDEAKIEIINQILGKDDIHWVFISVSESQLKADEECEVWIIARDEGTTIPKVLALNAGKQLVAGEFKEE